MTAENLIRAVKKHYQAQTYLTSKFSMKLDIETCYTELALVSQKEQEEKEKKHLGANKENGGDVQDRRIPSYEQLHTTKEKIELPQIFDKSETHKVVVLGRAGIGKSTLCHHMAYEWAHERLWENQFDLVIWVPLRNIAHYSPKEDSIAHIIQKECLSLNHGEYPLKVKKIRKCLAKNKLRILYLLDGFDEVSSLIATKSHQAKLLRLLFTLDNVLITSRPYSLDSFLSTLGNFKVDKTLENMGFSDKQSEQFIDRFFAEVKSFPDKALALQRHIETNPNIKGIAHIPVILLLMCKFWQNSSGEETALPRNMTELYSAITDNLCDQYVEDMLKKPRNELKVGERENLCRHLLLSLGRLAFKQMQKTELIISPRAIKDVIATTSPDLLFRDFVSFGLLTPTHENAKSKPEADEKDYYFVHLTFQEFFAAWHITERIKARDRRIYYFIRDNKYNPVYEIVWWFVAGQLRKGEEREVTENLDIFFGILESAPRDITQVYHLAVVMRCMDECQLHVSPLRRSTFLSRLILFIDHWLIHNKIESTSVLEHLAQSPIIFELPEIVTLFENRVDTRNYANTLRTLNILMKFPSIPKKITSKIISFVKLTTPTVNFFDDFYPIEEPSSDDEPPQKDYQSSHDQKLASKLAKDGTLIDHRCSIDAIESGLKVLGRQKNVIASDIIETVYALLDNPNKRLVNAALLFFALRENLPEKIILKILSLLDTETVFNVRELGWHQLQEIDMKKTIFAVLEKQVTLSQMVLSEIWSRTKKTDALKKLAIHLFCKNNSFLTLNIEYILELANDPNHYIRMAVLSKLKKFPCLPTVVHEHLLGMIDIPSLIGPTPFSKPNEVVTIDPAWNGIRELLIHVKLDIVLPYKEKMAAFKILQRQKSLNMILDQFIKTFYAHEKSDNLTSCSHKKLWNLIAQLFWSTIVKSFIENGRVLSLKDYSSSDPLPTFPTKCWPTSNNSESDVLLLEQFAKGCYLHKRKPIPPHNIGRFYNPVKSALRGFGRFPGAPINTASHLAETLINKHTPFLQKNLTFQAVGYKDTIEFKNAEAAAKFEADFNSSVIAMTGLGFKEGEEHFFEDLDHSVLCDRSIEKPNFLLEQEALCHNRSLQEKFRAIGEEVRRRGSPTVFLSHAWQFSPADDLRLGLNEQWADYCVKQLARDLRLLGFNPILDFEALGTGVHLPTAMREGIMTADHILIVCTDTYFYKLEKTVLSGVGRKLDLIKSRINPTIGMGVTKAHETRLLHGFLLTNKKPPGFSLFEGYDGFAGLWLRQMGYVNALLELVNKIFEHKINTDHVLDNLHSPTQTLKREGFFPTDDEHRDNRKIFSTTKTSSLILH